MARYVMMVTVPDDHSYELGTEIDVVASCLQELLDSKYGWNNRSQQVKIVPLSQEIAC